MPRRWSFGWKTWEPIEIDLGSEGKLVAEVSWQPGRKVDSPVLILLHGLEGSAQSHYLVGMSKKAYVAGFHTVRVNTRNCGGTEHLTPTLYSAALSGDVLHIVRHLKEAFGIQSIFAAAVSLGANILLKFLGEQGERGPDYLKGAALLSAPIDLAAGIRKMEEPQNWIYQRYFVRKLIARMRRKTALLPGLGDMRRIERIRTIREFDDLVTAPHFGFGTADNYYRLASSGPLLRHIRIPTLLIQSMDDPLIPFETFLNAGIEENPFLELIATENGGHAGFLEFCTTHPSDLDAYWGESRVVQFLTAMAGIPQA